MTRRQIGQPGNLLNAGGLVALAIWLLICLAGTICLTTYAARPAAAAKVATSWPAFSKLNPQPARATLVMFVHPRCPCSRASLHELDRLLAASRGEFDTTVVIVEPPGAGSGWANTDVSRFAAAIPGIQVFHDREGQETKRFGVRTSGEVAFYDAGGRLVFHGGITPARGHEGDSAGRDAILRWVNRLPAGKCSPAFGCPLLASTNNSADE